jgi:hypothetical protein
MVEPAKESMPATARDAIELGLATTSRRIFGPSLIVHTGIGTQRSDAW